MLIRPATGFDSASEYFASFKPLQGLVSGGPSRAIVGARVYVLQANTARNGDPSISLLTSATESTRDSIGNYVLTNEDGGFSIAGNYTCTAGHPVYLYVSGGNSGSKGSNPAIGLMAGLGACPETGTFSAAQPFIFVNEVSTVAAAYAMAGFATDAIHVSSSGTPRANHGAAEAADLASVATGFANSSLPSNPEVKVPQSTINTVANILAACINSEGPGSSECTTLFRNARSGGAAGAAPNETASAAINIAHNPRSNVAALYELQPRLGTPFLPALKSAPNDFSLTFEDESAGNSVASAAYRP